MKKLSITFGTILLVLGCFALSAAKADDGRPLERGPRIVGLWHVSLYLDPDHTQLFAETYKQWHSDGLEFESANLFPGALCVGTWQQMAANMVSLYHVGWTPGGVPGFPTAVRFVETETNTVSLDGNSYDGTGTQTFYDADGNPLEPSITLYIAATRLPPQ
jgi:hypothetical protein